MIHDAPAEHLQETDDAAVWARAWCSTASYLQTQGVRLVDEGWMVGWFANAIETAKRIEVERLADSDEFKSAVFQALGAASVCWESMSGTGVFQSDQAKALGDEFIAAVRERRLPAFVTERETAHEDRALIERLRQARPPLRMRLKFWRDEVPLRLRGWWRRHWWPERLRQLDRERADWKRWHDEAWQAANDAGVGQQVAEQAFRNRYGHEPEPGWWVG